jgi:4-amino-4-deoxy-L-arabinose transferase-like glycosyltransferase
VTVSGEAGVEAPPRGPAGDADAADGEVSPPASGATRAARLRARAERDARTYWPLLVIFVVALGIRLWGTTSWLPECSPEEAAVRTTLTECYAIGGDAYYYHSMANQVATGNGFQIVTFDYQALPKADHPPGYVLLLAGLNVVGLDTLSWHRTVLCLLGATTAALVGLLGWRLGGAKGHTDGRACGVVAGVLAAIYPGFWMSDVYYMSESLFVPFIVLLLLGAYRFWRAPGWINALVMGAAAGAAWLVRGEAALLLGLIVIGFVLFLRGVRFWRKVALGAAACAVCIGMMLPWVAYNLSRFEEPVYVATTGTALGLNSCDAVWYGEATGWYSFGCLNQYAAATQREDGVLTDAGVRQRATAYIRENFGELPRVATVRVLRLFGFYSNTDTIDRNVLAEGRRFDGVQAQHWMYYGLLGFGLVGLVVLRHRRVPISPLVAALVAVAFTAAGTFAIYRYRLAADVALMAATSVALVTGASWLRAVVTRQQPLVPDAVRRRLDRSSSADPVS